MCSVSQRGARPFEYYSHVRGVDNTSRFLFVCSFRMASDRCIQFFAAFNIILILVVIIYVSVTKKSLSHKSSSTAPVVGNSPTIFPTPFPSAAPSTRRLDSNYDQRVSNPNLRKGILNIFENEADMEWKSVHYV